MESEQNDNNVIVLDLCETDKGSIMKKEQSSTITNSYSWDDINSISLNNQNDDNVYYAKLCNNLFVKFKKKYVKNNQEKNDNNIELTNDSGLTFKKENNQFILKNHHSSITFDTDNKVFNLSSFAKKGWLDYKATLNDLLNKPKAELKLYQPSFFGNLFSPINNSTYKGTKNTLVSRLCGESANQLFPNRWFVGCFSCGDVVVNDDIKNGDDTLPARISLEDVSLEKSYIKHNSQ